MSNPVCEVCGKEHFGPSISEDYTFYICDVCRSKEQVSTDI
jgi:hypothetical protein